MSGQKAKKKRPDVKQRKNFIVAAVLLGLLLLVFVISQIVVYKSRGYTSEIALSDKYEKTISADMFIVRDEKIVSSSGGNVISAVDDGTRVKMGDIIAYSFADSQSAGNVLRMQEISELLEYYEELNNKSVIVASDTTSYDNRIIDALCSFSAAASSGEYHDLSSAQNKIRDAITSKQTATGIELDLSATMDSLRAEYSTLSASASAYSQIYADSSGYYIQGTDGFENILSYSDVGSWSLSQVEKALDSYDKPAVHVNSVGRIVHGYYWYMVCVVDMGDVADLKEGNIKTIIFPDSTVGSVSAEVYSIRADSPTKKAVVIFRCNAMNEDIATLRFEKAEIELETHEGFRIDNDAIRVNDKGEKGVYTISGRFIRFKKIRVLYSTDEYSIVTNKVKNEDTGEYYVNNSYLSLYDEYITSGKDIYDNKIIK